MPEPLSLKACSLVNDFNTFLGRLQPQISKWGGRKFQLVESLDKTCTMNQLVHQFEKCAKNRCTLQDTLTGLDKLAKLDSQANARLQNKKQVSNFQRILTKLRQIVGNLWHKARYKSNRFKVLEKIRQAQAYHQKPQIQNVSVVSNSQKQTDSEIEAKQKPVEGIAQKQTTSEVEAKQEPVMGIAQKQSAPEVVVVTRPSSHEIPKELAGDQGEPETGKNALENVGEQTEWENWDWDEDDRHLSESEEESTIESELSSRASLEDRSRLTNERMRRAFLSQLSTINLTAKQKDKLISIFNVSMLKSRPRAYFQSEVKAKINHLDGWNYWKVNEITEKLEPILPIAHTAYR